MIYFIRHGQTDWNVVGRIQGRTDIELNAKGFEQATIMKEKLEKIIFDKVFSSPLKRTLQTAKIVTDKKICIDSRLIERGNGKMEGRLTSEIKVFPDFNDPNETLFEIENITDFRKRIYDFFNEITKKYKNKNILVVSHAGVGIYAKCYFYGEPKNNDYDALKIDNCEVIEFNN